LTTYSYPARREFLRAGAAAVMGALFAPIAGAADPTPGPVVETAAGKIRGLSANGVAIFKGVRYGASTEGEGRWAPPQPLVKWTGVQDAFEFGQTAPQVGGRVARMGEDCLVLNVWTPATGPGKRPVMVWFHPGGFNSGSGSSPECDGTRLAAGHDVVVVTLNHRIGAVGFIYLDQLTNGRIHTGNLGMLDLAAALNWVKQNISAFGGDPNNVTIFGQSGGGRKVTTFSSMPAGKGLYHRIVIESGPAIRQQVPEMATRYTEAFLKALGVGPDLKALRAIPLDKIVAAQAASQAPADMPLDGIMKSFAPVIDGVTILRDAYNPTAPEVSATIPMMVGTTRFEQASMFRSDQDVWNRRLTRANVEERLKPIFGADAEKVVSQYLQDYPDLSPSEIFLLADTERSYWINTVRVAERRAANKKAPTWTYRFDWNTPVQEGKLKSPHGVEVPFVFDNAAARPDSVGSGEVQNDLARRLSATWTTFARTANPNNPLAPDWRPYTVPERATMLIDAKWSLVNDPNAGVRRFLERI
jgi:para-nitrobenzyl esterase